MEHFAPGRLALAVRPLFLRESDLEYWLPDACVIEVANALRKHRLRNPRFTYEHLARALTNFLGYQPVLFSAADLVPGMIRHLGTLSAYDAAYVALAEAQDVPIITLDGGVEGTARRAGLETLRPGTAPFDEWIQARRN